MTPEIFHGSATSLAIAWAWPARAARTDRGDHRAGRRALMAETSKVLCMDKKVLIPDLARAAARWPPRSPPPMCG
ncbi:MAG: hypothetical protein WDM85_15615 [Caulobacteraceae bacterium]